jgi:hypothetical protein
VAQCIPEQDVFSDIHQEKKVVEFFVVTITHTSCYTSEGLFYVSEMLVSSSLTNSLTHERKNTQHILLFFYM